MRLSIVRVQMDKEEFVDIKDFEELVNSQCELLEGMGWKIHNISVERYRNKLTAFIQYKKSKFIFWL